MNAGAKIRQTCLDHFNEPILIDFQIARLIGCAEDDDDCYLIINVPGKGIQRHTASGGYIFLNVLRGQNRVVPNYPSFEGEIWDDLYRLDSLLTIRGVPPEEHFLTN